jgi:hypothetical protein
MSASAISHQNFLIGKIPGSDEYIGKRSPKTLRLLEKCAQSFDQKGFNSTQYENHLTRIQNERKICVSLLDSLPTDLAALAIDLGQDFLRTAVTDGNRRGFSFHNGCRYLWFPTRGIAKKTRWNLIEKGYNCDDIFLCGALEVIILEKWCHRTVSW